jgi:hypothetical protein
LVITAYLKGEALVSAFRNRRIVMLQGFLAAMAISVSAACSGGTSSVPSSTSATPSASVPPGTSPPAAVSAPSSSPASDPQQLEQQFSGLGYAVACGGMASAGAAPYAGPGPHPVDFEGDSNFSANGNADASIADAGLYGGDMDVFDLNGILQSSSANARIEPANWVPASAARVQLVACVTMGTTTTGAGSCRYTNKHATMDAARYTLTLYVARTGRKLAGPVSLQGSDHACPGLAISYGSSLEVYASLGLNQIDAIIGKYVR